MYWTTLLGLGGAALAAAASLRHRTPASLSVEIDDEGVRRWVGGAIEAVRWADLVEVGIVTTADGPFSEDIFWLLQGSAGGGCAVPGSAAAPLLARLQRLPRFDNLTVVKACGTVEEASFRVWQGEAGEGLAAAHLGPDA